MNNIEKGAAPTGKAWVKPELKRMDAGSAENSPNQGLPDGNTGQNPRNQFVS